MVDPKIESLLTVAKYGNFTRAAEVLSLTQPAVSHHIKQLENELGVIIFSRKKGDLKLVFTGSLAGIANGLFGAGGGMVLVPLLCRWIKIPQEKALATSVAVILPMSIVSATVYYLNRSFTLPDALPFLIGGLVGGFIGGKVFKNFSPTLLRNILAVMILWGGIRNLIG